MSRGVVGAAAGTAATTIYLRPDLVVEWARNAATRGSALAAQPGLGSGELQQLTQLVSAAVPALRALPDTR
jgi:hypothetical protein